MADNTQQAHSTDELIEVFEHLSKREDSWETIIAEHGLDPTRFRRALCALVPAGDERQNFARAVFVWGLQFGAMRLPAFPYDAKAEESPCNCLLCQLRAALAGEGGGRDRARVWGV